MSDIKSALALAYEAHQWQFDKAGDSYILHPLRVGLSGANETETICGFLHDVVEDTGVTLDLIRALYGAKITDIIDRLTRRETESYQAYVERVSLCPFASAVKLLDIADNRARMHKLGPNMAERLDKKYAEAEYFLTHGAWPV